VRLYLSGPFDHSDDIREVGEALTRIGHVVTSNWLDEPPIVFDDPEHQKWERRARANDDLADIYRSDGIVVFTDWPSTSGGRDVEKGAAIVYRQFVRQHFRLIVVGPDSNVFDDLAAIERHESIGGFLFRMGQAAAVTVR